MASLQVAIHASLIRHNPFVSCTRRGMVFEERGNPTPGRGFHFFLGPLRGPLTLNVRAVETSGSRRDMQKIFARTHHRRTRHVKGLEPKQRDMEDELNYKGTVLLPTEESRAQAASSSSPQGRAAEAKDKEPVWLEGQLGSAADEGNASSESGTNSIPSTVTKPTRVVKSTNGLDLPPTGMKAGAGELASLGTQQDENERRGEEKSDISTALEDAGNASQDAMETVSDTVREVSKDVEEASSEVSSAAADIGGTALYGSREVLEKLGKDGREVSEDLGEALSDAGVAAVDASADAAEILMDEARAGLEDGNEETDVKTSAYDKESVKVPVSPEVEGSEHSVTQGDKEPQLQRSAEEPSYKDLTVLVAGANGRLGRAVVEALVDRKAKVRALVRDASKARYLKELRGVTVVEGDVYKFETLKKALGDSDSIIVTTGVVPSLFDPLASYKVDYEGTQNLVALAKNSKDIKKFVLVTSLGVSLLLFPVNLIGGILFWKKMGEQVLQRSGLDYTIVRPGGLVSTQPQGRNLVLKRADSQFGGAITRAQVAEICVTALIIPEASGKIAEAVTEEGAPKRSIEDLFAAL